MSYISELFKERRLVLSDKSQLFTVCISPADHTQGEGGLLIGQFSLVSLVLTRVADFVWTWNISHSYEKPHETLLA